MSAARTRSDPARQYVNDTHYSYQAWADATGIFDKKDVIQMEREMLTVLQFHLQVKSEDLTAHYTPLMAKCCPQTTYSSLGYLPDYSFRALSQSCDEYYPGSWSPVSSVSSASSLSSPDSPALLTPEGSILARSLLPAEPWHRTAGAGAPLNASAGSVPHAKDPWMSFAPPRRLDLSQQLQYPLYTPPPDQPSQKNFGDAPEFNMEYDLRDLLQGFNNPRITLPHLSEIIPPSLVHPERLAYALESFPHLPSHELSAYPPDHIYNAPDYYVHP